VDIKIKMFANGIQIILIMAIKSRWKVFLGDILKLNKVMKSAKMKFDLR
jgi:hypothetical protein